MQPNATLSKMCHKISFTILVFFIHDLRTNKKHFHTNIQFCIFFIWYLNVFIIGICTAGGKWLTRHFCIKKQSVVGNKSVINTPPTPYSFGGSEDFFSPFPIFSFSNKCICKRKGKNIRSKNLVKVTFFVAFSFFFYIIFVSRKPKFKKKVLGTTDKVFF